MDWVMGLGRELGGEVKSVEYFLKCCFYIFALPYNTSSCNR